MTNTTISIDSLTMELVGIKENLYLLSAQFENTDRKCTISNEVIGDTLNSIACHIGRISDDLETYSVTREN